MNREDIPFRTANGRELKLDLYPAEGKDQRTAVILVHGGGWRRGSRKMLAPNAEILQGYGFTCLAVEYRLVPESPWPAMIHDVKAAIRWTRAHAAELGVDAGRIAMLGSSAGGHLVMLAAGTPDRPEFEGDGDHLDVSSAVNAVIGVFPPTELGLGDPPPNGLTPARAVLGDAATEELARQISPMTYVSHDFPPSFFIHGSLDRTVSPKASTHMHKALRAARAVTDIHVFGDQGHGFTAVKSFREVVMAEVALFLRRALSDREGIAREAEERRAAMAAANGGAAR